MRRIGIFTENGVTLRQDRTILTVDQIMQQYLTNGQIPAALNSRPYDFESEIDEKGQSHPKDFTDMNRDLHPDLLVSVSRESRMKAAKKAAIVTATPNPSANVSEPSSSASELTS